MEQQPRLPLWFLVANWALIVAAFVLGLFLGGRRHADLPKPQSTALELIYDEILQHHVEPQDGHVLLDRAIAGMVDGLDEYSQYVPPHAVARYDEASTGRYEGVGMRQVLHGNELVVYYAFPDGPAARAGVLPGDRLLAVDGQRLAEMPRETREARTVELVRGAADTDVRLLLQRGQGEIELVVRRGPVQQPAVKWVHLADPELGLGYLYLGDFHHGVADQVLAAIERLQAQSPLRGLVIDLRFDGGGSLEECLTLARAFQKEGVIVSTRRRNQVVETQFADAAKCRFPDLPLVLLVNEYSASASEVLAGCLQDHGRATIVGTRTYGKGYVNTVYSWKDLPFRLKLTTAHYYTPSGRNIDRQGHRKQPSAAKDGSSAKDGTAPAEEDGGIAPDVVVTLPPEQLRQVESRLRRYEVPAAAMAAFNELAARLGIEVPTPPIRTEDRQLDLALQALHERIGQSAKPK